MKPIIAILLLIISAVIYLFLGFRFLRNLKKYNYIGNLKVYLILAYLACLIFSLYANFAPASLEEVTNATVNGVETTIVQTHELGNPLVLAGTSLFDAIKMLAVAFDQARLASYLNSPEWYNVAFGFGYVITSILGLVFASLSVIIGFMNSFGPKERNFRAQLSPAKEIYYIFSDPKVTIAAKLGSELKRSGKVVIMFVSAASQKTQEGTEYRDMLLSKGLEVRSERFSCGLARYLFNKHFNKKFWLIPSFFKKRKVRVFGLFSDDETSVELAGFFKEAVKENRHFQRIVKKKEDGSLDIVGKKSVERLKSFRVFLTYHESDIDITGNYSRDTAHIVNTLSEYDIVSSQFLLDNQITNFVDLSKVDEVDNKGFHVTFLGLGKINRPIMEKMTFAYQLWGDNINKVTYHIMDREAEDRVIPFTNVFTREDRPIQEGEKVSRVPLLYRAVAEKDITDFNSYEVLSSYFAKIKASESKEEEPTRFNKNGFEIFVISASNTSMDINVAKLLQKAILHNFTDQPERLSKTVIFVRIGNAATASSFKSDPTIVTQKEINNGYLFKEDHILVPIVIFGEDALMSDFLNRHYDMIERVGTKSLLTFYKTDAEEKWLLCDKKETLVNTVTVYTLKPRLALLGYRLSDDYRITDKDGKEVEKSSYQTHVKELIDGCVYPDSGLGHPVMKLAEMEHNRWASFEYLLHSYETWKWEDFKAYNQKKLAENPDRKKFYTKNENLTCHVCMLTNKALEKLEEDLNTTFPGKEFDEYAHKLVYKNDVDTMKNVFDALCVEKKGKGERK